MPPVAKILIPTRLATISVPATVVAPFQFWLKTYAKSRRDVFTVLPMLMCALFAFNDSCGKLFFNLSFVCTPVVVVLINDDIFEIMSVLLVLL